MKKILTKILKAVPTLVSLFRKDTPEEGKGIVSSGIASLTIAGLISTGRLSAGQLDSTLLIVLAILEVAGYLFGVTALSAGASQSCPDQELLAGKGEGLSSTEAKALGRQWARMKQRKLTGERPDRAPERKDLSNYFPDNQNPNQHSHDH
jgi:hypothetical protein